MTDANAKPDDGTPAERLSADEAAQLAGRVADLAQAGLPLAAGLRAAAAELPGGRLARAMVSIAAALERGQTLEQAFASQKGRFPADLGGLIAAGVRTGRLGEVLQQFVRFRQFTADVRRNVRVAIGYPLLLLGLTVALFAFLLHEFAPFAAQLDTDFGFATPAFGIFHFRTWMSQFADILLGGLATAVGITILLGWFAGAARRRRVMNRVPLLGPVWRNSGLAEFAQLLRLLVEAGLPLPEALRLTAGGISDADVAVGCRGLAERIEAGQPLSAALNGLPQFAPVSRTLLAWGETNGALAAALDATAQLSARQVELRGELLRWIVPPAVLILIASGLVTVVAMFARLISALSSLSWGPRPDVEGINRALGFIWGGLLVSALLGAAILVWLRFVNAKRWEHETLCRFANAMAVVLLGLAIVGAFVVPFGWLGLELGLACMVIWGMAVFRLRQTQRAVLLELLELAVRRGIPLEPLVRAFSAEQVGEIGRRAARLSNWLSDGVSLGTAAGADGKVLSPPAILAVEFGEANGSLAVALHQARDSSAASARNWEGTTLGWIWIMNFCGIGLYGGTFMLVQIVPQFVKIFKDFGTSLPPFTLRVLAFFGSPAVEWSVGLMTLFVVLASIRLAFYVMGFQGLGLPLVDRMLAPLDAAVVLRWLAIPAERGEPLEPTLCMLASRFPKRFTRRRLLRAADAVLGGADWIASLRKARLVRAADAAVLQAASRVGNLGWALSEAAAGGERLVAYRLQALSNILFPILVLIAGFFVLLFVVGCFLPLVDLITRLAAGR